MTDVSKTPETSTSLSGKHSKNALWILIASVVGALLIGWAIGHFLTSGSSSLASPAFPGKTAVSKEELSKPLARYTYNGKTNEINALDVISATSNLDSFKAEKDGTYFLPSAETTLSLVRERITDQIAHDEGVNISKDEIKAFMKEQFKTDDIKTLSQTYRISEDQAQKFVDHSALLNKLYKKVMKQVPNSTLPTMPEAPKDKKDNGVKNEAYYKQIVQMLGNNWNTEKNTWADEKSPLKSELASLDLSSKTASYDDAMQVYYATLKEAQKTAAETRKHWTEFLNSRLSKAVVTIRELNF